MTRRSWLPRLTNKIVMMIITAIIVFQVSPDRAMAGPVSYAASASASGTSFATTFTATDDFGDNTMFDVELWDATNKRVFQHYEVQDGNGRSSITITQPITAGLPAGTYTVKGGIFSADWSARMLWAENITTFAVGAAGISALDSSSRISNTTFTTLFTNSVPFNGQYVFDVELWNSDNKRVYQYFDTMNVANSTGVTIAKQLPSWVAKGSYTAKTGVFTPSWANRLLWNENSGSVTVGIADTPITYTSVSTVTNDGSTFQTTFSSSRPVTGSYLFDVELWDNTNKRVFQSFDTTSLTNSSTMTLTRDIPDNVPAGTYTVKSGWFTPYWSSSLLWNERSGTVQVGSVTPAPTTTTTVPAPPTTTTTEPAPTTTTSTTTPSTTTPSTTTTTVAQPTTTSVPTSAPPPPAVPSAPLTFGASSSISGAMFNTTFTATKSLNGRYLYDVELYDSANKKAYQYFEVQDMSDDTSAHVSTPLPSNLPAGTYRAKAGVFSDNWTTKYLWSNDTGTVTVSSVSKPVTSTGPGPVGMSGTWSLAFGDEFNGSQLDTTKWTTCSRQLIWWKNNCMGHGSELQTYVDDNVNIVNFAEGGRGVRLTAKREGTWSFSHDDVPAGSPRWTSGMISTSPNTMGFDQPGYKPFDFTYGFYEMRMRMPKGRGFWPAGWAFPSDNVGPQELDVIEVLGHDTKTSHMTVHYDGGGQSSLSSTSVDTADGFHTFGMDWQPDHIDWYIDGRLARSTFTKAGVIPNKDMYLMLNFAVGGVWPGSPDGATPQVAATDIDWVHVWKRS